MIFITMGRLSVYGPIKKGLDRYVFLSLDKLTLEYNQTILVVTDHSYHFAIQQIKIVTEKEKMLRGETYNSRDPELIKMYHRARKFLKVYNNLDSELLQEREQILNELLEFKGTGVWIEAPFYCDYGEHISIGNNTFVNTNCIFLDNNKITIGENGLIAPYVQIYTANHPLKASERIIQSGNSSRYLTSTKPVTIGDNVWIGGNSVIFPGVTIGHHVTIGAGSVVTKDIPDHVLAYGNPCKVIKELR